MLLPLLKTAAELSSRSNTNDTNTIAINLEQARKQLFSLILLDDAGIHELLKQCVDHLERGGDLGELLTTKSAAQDIVQEPQFVQDLVKTFVDNPQDLPAFKHVVSCLHFLPLFLLQVSASLIVLLKDTGMQGEVDASYRQKLQKAQDDLHRWRQLMVSSNINLVSFAARQHKITSLTHDDVVQEGVIGLMKAIDRFDPERGFQFSTYAMPWIKQAISRLIVKQERIVRLPVGLAEKSSSVFKVMREYYLTHQRWPSLMQLKALSPLSEDELKTISRYYQDNHSLDVASGDEEDGMALMDTMQQKTFKLPLDELIDGDLNKYLDEVVDSLSEKEADILVMRFGLRNHTEMTLQAIADQLQVTRERVRQIQNTALSKIKQRFGCDLKLFLEGRDTYLS